MLQAEARSASTDGRAARRIKTRRVGIQQHQQGPPGMIYEIIVCGTI